MSKQQEEDKSQDVLLKNNKKRESKCHVIEQNRNLQRECKTQKRFS